MAGTEDIRGYVRVVGGKAVVVKPHSRTNNEVADASRKLPGRPMVTAQSGSFPGGRSVPNLWPQDVAKEVDTPDEEIADEDKVLPPAKSLREAAQRIMDELKGYQDTPAARRVKKLLLEANYDDFYLASEDPEVLELAVRTSLGKGIVGVRNYTRVVNGKVVHVRAYTQIRDLLSKFGGPSMAAKKGITQNLLVDAMQMSNRLPKGQAAKTVSKAKASVKNAKRVSSSTKETLERAKAPKSSPNVSANAPNVGKKAPSAPEIVKPTQEDDAPKNNTKEAAPKSRAKTPQEAPKPVKREFTSPIGTKFDLEPGDVVRQHRNNPSSLAVYGEDGAMKYRILPSGKKGDVPTNVNDSMWRDYTERGTIRDYPTTTTPSATNLPKPNDTDTPPDAPKPVRRVFTHPNGNDFVLRPGEKILRHKMQKDSYAVLDKDGEFKYQITPSGKSSLADKDTSFYEEFPEVPQDVAPEATPDVDAPNADPGAIPPLRTIREDKSEAWNRGAMAVVDQRLVNDPMDDPWMAQRADSAEAGGMQEDLREFNAGYEYAQDQATWWERQAQGESQPQGINLDEAFRPDGFQEPEDAVETPEAVGSILDVPKTIYDDNQPEAWNWGVSWFQDGFEVSEAIDALDDHFTRAEASPSYIKKTRASVIQGFGYGAEQKNAFDKWVDGVEPPEGFIFDKILYPQAREQVEEARLKNVLSGPNLEDNESWRKTEFTEAEKWKKAGYDQFRPGFEQQPSPWEVPEFQDQVLTTPDAENRSREEQIRQGFRIAEKEWAEANKVKADIPDEQNRGAQFFTATNKPLPPSATDSFRKGYVEARRELATKRLEEANLPVSQESVTTQSDIIEAARRDGRTVPPVTSSAKQTIHPETVARWTAEERAEALGSPDKFIDKIVDRAGFIWERDEQGGWVSEATTTRYGLTELINKRVTPARTLSMDEVLEGSEDGTVRGYLDSLPEGTTLVGPDGQRITTRNNDVFINGTKIPASRANIVLNSLVDNDVTHHKADSTRDKARAANETLNTKNALTISLEGMPESVRRLVTSNTHIRSPKGRAYVDNSPSVLAFVSPPDGANPPRLELPEQNLDFDGVTPNTSGVEVLKVNIWDRQSRNLPDGVKASSAVTGSNNRFNNTVVHETGHYLEHVANQTLTPAEQRDMFSDMAEAVISELPEDLRQGFDNFAVQRGNQYTNRPVVAGERGYELNLALEYAMSVDNGLIPSQLSTYATTNHAELIAEAWTDYKLNPNASPLATKIGNILERATKFSGARLDKLRVGEESAERYSRAYKKPLPTPSAAALDVFSGKILSRGSQDSLASYFREVTDTPTDIALRKNGLRVMWEGGSMDVDAPVKSWVAINIDDSSVAGVDVHEAMLRLAKNAGAKHAITRDSGVRPALLGYDFHPKYRDQTLRKVLDEVDKRDIPAKNQARWDQIRALVDSGETKNITPIDIQTIGQFEDGNILDNIGEWVGYTNLDNYSTPALTSDLSLSVDPSYKGLDHGVPLRSPNDAKRADKLFGQVATYFSELPPAELGRYGKFEPKDNRPYAIQVAAKIVDAHFGADPSNNNIFAAMVLEDQIGPEPTVNSPKELDDFNRWKKDHPEASDALDYLRERFGGINDLVRYGEADDSDVEALDEAFKTAPRLTTPVQISIPTTRTTTLPAGKVIADKGFLRGSPDQDDEDDTPRMLVDLDEGQQVLWDGWNYVLPRYTQLTIVESDEGKNLMRAEVRREPLPTKDFSTPPTERFPLPSRKRPRPDITPEDLRHMSVKEISDLFFGIGIPTEIFRWLLDLLDVAFAFAFVT